MKVDEKFIFNSRSRGIDVDRFEQASILPPVSLRILHGRLFTPIIRHIVYHHQTEEHGSNKDCLRKVPPSRPLLVLFFI